MGEIVGLAVWSCCPLPLLPQVVAVEATSGRAGKAITRFIRPVTVLLLPLSPPL